MADPRDLTIQGSFGDGELVLDRLFGHDSLSLPFEYTVELHSKDRAFDISSLVGDTVTVAFDIQGDQTRYINGYVTRMTRGSGFDDYAQCPITVCPWFFLLSSRANSRVFQNHSVPDIAKALFREHGFADFEVTLSDSYPAHEFVVQYRESDFTFVSRLLEKAGIYYFFRHEKARHVMVLADAATTHKPRPGYEKVAFHPEGSSTPDAGEYLNRWRLVHQWRPGTYTSNDFDFQRAEGPPDRATTGQRSPQEGRSGDLRLSRRLHLVSSPMPEATHRSAWPLSRATSKSPMVPPRRRARPRVRRPVHPDRSSARRSRQQAIPDRLLHLRRQ